MAHPVAAREMRPPEGTKTSTTMSISAAATRPRLQKRNSSPTTRLRSCWGWGGSRGLHGDAEVGDAGDPDGGAGGDVADLGDHVDDAISELDAPRGAERRDRGAGHAGADGGLGHGRQHLLAGLVVA